MLEDIQPANECEKVIADRVNYLLQNPQLKKGTNCIGTFLQVIGLKPDLKVMNVKNFSSIYDRTPTREPKLGDLVLFESIDINEIFDGEIIHAAVFLDSINGDDGRVFSQKGFGGDFKVESLNDLAAEYPAKYSFYRLKEIPA